MEEGRRPRSPRVLERLQVIAVHSRRDMAALLSDWRWLLDQIAHRRLGETPEAHETVNALVARMLALESPDMPHALRTVTQALHVDCRAVLRKRARRPSKAEAAWAEDRRYDPVLHAWTERMTEAVKDLPEAQRTAFELVSIGVSVRDIATALGVQPRTIGMHLYRARQTLREGAGKKSAAFLPGMIGAQRVWHRLQAGAAHLHGAGVRRAGSFDRGAFVVPQVVKAAVLASIVVWMINTPVAPGAATGGGQQVPGPGGAAARSIQVSAETGRPAGPSAMVVARALHVPAMPVLHRPARAIARAEQRQLLAVAPAPNYQQNHTIVALGDDPAQGSSVLFQSTDGGHDWTEAPGPPSGTEIALPPDYPTDPRIFIGSPAELAGGSDYVADRFGGAFTPLPGSGLVALSGTFDSASDETAYIATSSGVAAVDLSTGVPAAPVVASGIWGLVTLATRPGSPGVLAVAPPGSLAPGATSELAAAAPGDSLLLGCLRSSCSRVADLGATAVRSLVVSSTYATDHTLAAYTDGQLLVSTTGGSSFETLPLPSSPAVIGSLAVAADRIWAVTGAPAGAVRLSWLPVEGGTWHDIASPDPVLNARGVLVAIGTDRLLFLAHAQGFRCTGDAGRSWASACPTAG